MLSSKLFIIEIYVGILLYPLCPSTPHRAHTHTHTHTLTHSHTHDVKEGQ
jgi:hypothetical protein